MHCREHRHIELMNSRVGFVGNPQKAKWSIQGQLHPPAPSDDLPDFAEQWLWYEIEIVHLFCIIDSDYGESRPWMEPLAEWGWEGSQLHQPVKVFPACFPQKRRLHR